MHIDTDTDAYSIVDVPRFIEATRSSGYKTTANAVAELVDNSFQAIATEVDIHILEDSDDGGLRVMCIDNGYGMTSPMLRNAMRFGGSSRFDDRSGLGRFGMGLPNASLSQCRRVEVHSWHESAPGKKVHCYLDVDEVRDGRMKTIPEPIEGPLPRELQPFDVNEKSGTIVVWRRCDRIDVKKPKTLAARLETELARIFRQQISEGCTIRVLASTAKEREPVRTVQAIDPLFLNTRARWSGANKAWEKQFALRLPDGGTASPVTVRIAILPEEWQTKGFTDETLRHFVRNRAKGFSILRHGREVDCGLFNFRRSHWTDMWWSGEIEFQPEIDDLFGITHTKQQVSLSDTVYQEIRKPIQNQLKLATQEIVDRGVNETSAFNFERLEAAAQQALSVFPLPERVTSKSKEVCESELTRFLDDEVDNVGPLCERLTLMDPSSAKTFLMGLEQGGAGPILRVREVGKSFAIIVNRNHPFIEHHLGLDRSHGPAMSIAMMLLSIAMDRALKVAVQPQTDTGEFFAEAVRTDSQWSRILAYFAGLPSMQSGPAGSM